MKIIELEHLAKSMFWKASIQDDIITYTWGHKGSDKIQTKIDKGELKNAGRSNEVSPELHAIQKAVLKTNEKIEKNEYTLVHTDITLADYTSKERKEIFSDVPKPMLAHTLNEKQFDLKVKDKVLINCQPKIDGYRMLFNRITKECFSRSRKLITSVPHLADAISLATKHLPDDVVWVDGEIYSDEVTFSKLQSIIGKKKEIDEEVAKTIYYNIFDVISDIKFSERAKLVDEFIVSNKYVKIVATEWIDATMNSIKEKHGEYIEQGYEGIMIRLDNYNKGSKLIELPYEFKRSYSLFKYKQFFDSEYEIIDSESEEVLYQGNDYTVTKTVTLQNNEGENFKARPKMNVIDRSELWNNRDSIVGLFGKVKYQELSEYNVPRFPVLLSVREDFDR